MRFLAGNAAAVEHSGKTWMYVTLGEMSCKRAYERLENVDSALAPGGGQRFRAKNQITQAERSVGRYRRARGPLADSPVAVRTWPPFARQIRRNPHSSSADWCNEEPCPNARA